MVAKLDLVGLRFGHLIVESFAGKERNKGGASVRKWTCLCDCGNNTEVPTGALRSGNTITCGCKLSSKAKLHGLWESRIYQCWADMKARCNNPKLKAYKNYGGRGITYDQGWESFDVFLKDMGETYRDDLTLDREDTNGNYEKNNCKWKPRDVQARNRRMLKKNSSGVTGVRWTTDRSGTLYAAGSVMVEGKAKERHFSVKKYGLLPAFKMACDYRESMIDKLNDLGYGYSENHGK